MAAVREEVSMPSIPGDFHVHTKWCGHAVGEMEEYVLSAVEAGLPALGFSAHFPMPVHQQPYKVCLEEAEVPLFVEEFRRLKAAYADKIQLLMGFEVDFVDGEEERVRTDCIERWRPDYLIGSVHIVGDWPFDHPDFVDRYERWNVTELYLTYFCKLRRMVRSGLFDVVGHLDLVKKFGHRPEGDVGEAVSELLDEVKAQGMLVEMNTAGFDKPVGEMYPSDETLCEVARRGIPLTLGSDAHAPQQVGRYFDRAVEAAERAGSRDIRLPRRR